MSAGSELSKIFVVDPLPETGLNFEMTATRDERAALAHRFDLLALDHLAAAGWIRRGGLDRSVAVEGRLQASAVQACVVTTEPLPIEIDTSFQRLFAASSEPTERDVELDPLADEPEPLLGRELDLGEIVAEELALALPSYPRAPGAGLPEGEAPEPSSGPFGALARLRTP